MSTVNSGTRATPTVWAGWVQFAAVILLLNGLFSVVQGLVAVVGPSTYFTVVEGSVFLFDASGWGWWNLIIGTLLILTSVALFREAGWARVLAIILAAISGVVQMMVLPSQPWWALIVIAIDVTIIYALVARGAELKTRA